MLLAIIGGCTSNPALCPHLPHLPHIHLASANDQPNGEKIATDADVSNVQSDVEDAVPLSAEEEARVAEEAKAAGEDQTVGDLLKGKKGSITSEPDRVSRGPRFQDAVLGRGDSPLSCPDRGSTPRS